MKDIFSSLRHSFLNRLNCYSKQLLTLALPIISSLLLQIAYNFIDIFWVGKIGSDAVAAVGSAGFFIHLGMALCAIVSAGVAIKTSHAIGARDRVAKNRYSAAALVMAIVLGMGYGLCSYVYADSFIGLLSIDEEGVVDLAKGYYRIISFGLPIFFLNIIFTGIVNANKKTKVSFKAVLYGNILNIVLDPIFILVLDMGVDGAAYATVTAWYTSFLFFYHKIVKEKLILFWYKGIRRGHFLSIIRVGSATATQRVLFTLIAIMIGRIVASFGAESIAAQKLGLQIESLTFMIVAGVDQALTIMVGQAYGAKKYADIRFYYNSTIKISLVIAAITTSLFLFIPERLIGLFVENATTIEVGAMYLRIIGLSQVFMVVEMATGSAFNGMGLTHYSATISVLFTVIRIPIALYLSGTELGVNGIWVAIALSTLLKGIISYSIYQYKYKRLIRRTT